MDIGVIIRKARVSNNFTQQYAAKKAGLSVTAYGDIERGKTDPAWSRVVAIANAFGMEVTEMLSYDLE